jgi:adenosylmethionine-8-amino-7-oxononanoate aminotransferase
MDSSLATRDRNTVWHPYTPQKYAPDPIPIVKGERSWLIDVNGNRYLDAISSWWVNVHGHAHPHIAQSIYQQALRLEQVIFAGFTHEPAVQLAERILGILPGKFEKVFYSDNGSTATEVAVKMAIQFWKNQGINKPRVLALTNSYHGDTFGAMSFSERGLFTQAFSEHLFDVLFAELPQPGQPLRIHGYDANAAEDLLSQCACVIYEPLIQGAGGMIMYDEAALDWLIGECKKHGMLCIADEVMTGFGRTGVMFASELCINKPDIICLSKGLTGGTMALGVTACTQKVYEAFVDDRAASTFYHGHSYTANPIACSAALASLDLFSHDSTLANIRRISDANKAFASLLQEKTDELQITNVRTRGTILAYDKVVEEAGYTSSVKKKIMDIALQRGVLLRPLGNVVYIMPPYCITDEELQMLYEVMEGVAKRES